MAAVGGMLLAGSLPAQQDMDMEITGFRVPEYDAQGVMTSQIFGERAEMRGGGEVKITGLKVEFYKEGSTAVTVTSPYCFYNRTTREAHSDAPVFADAGRLTLRGRGFLLKAEESTVRVYEESEVTILDASQSLLTEGAVGEGGGTNVTVITSKELFLDHKARKARFERDVHVQDSKMEMYCDELEILFNENNEIDWIGARTDVRILQGEREAFAGMAEYDVKTDEFVLKDNPRILDGRNMLSGDQIRFWRESRRMVCEPSARMVVYSDESINASFFEK
jgi:lipopolysaccharide export system protein LptA